MAQLMDILGAAVPGVTQGYMAGTKFREDLNRQEQEMKLKQDAFKLKKALAEFQMQELARKVTEAQGEKEAKGALVKRLTQGQPVSQTAWGDVAQRPEAMDAAMFGEENATVPPTQQQQLAGQMIAAGLTKDADLAKLLGMGGTTENKLVPVAPGATLFDPTTRQPVYSAPAAPTPASAMNNPYAIARSLVGLKTGEVPNEEQAQRIYAIVEAHARAKGISPESQVFNDALAETGDIEQAKQRVIEFRGGKARTESKERVLGANIGPAREAQVETAGAKAEETATRKNVGELKPIASPTTGQVVPGVTAVGQAKAAGEAIPASERKALSELAVLNKLADSVEKNSKDFTEDFFGPVTGRLATVREKYTGTMGEAEVSVRRDLGDIKDTLLRARSGAQINEQEYNRLSKLVPDITDPPSTAKFKMKSFREALRFITEERQRLQGITGGSLGSAPSTPQVPTGGLQIKSIRPLPAKGK